MDRVSVSPRVLGRARSAMVLAALAGACASAAWAQQNQPGAAPGSPQPGQPQSPKPDFVMPQPNRGEEKEEPTVKPRPTEKPSTQPPAPAPKPATPADKAAPIAPGTPAAPPAGPVPIQQQEGLDTERPSYLVSAFVIRYAAEHPSVPPLDDLQKREVVLGRTADGYVAPGGGVEEVTTTIEDIALAPPQKWTSRALFQVSKAILDEMNQRGVVGVTVAPIDTEFGPPEEGDPDWGKDLRRPGQSAVTLVVRFGVVTEMRTLAFGDRIPFEQRIDAPQHKRILENSPVRVYAPDDPERIDVLRKDLLEDYVFRLNRHPGRRVDIAVSSAVEPGGIALDLLVNEAKPWLVYFQVSNTGTKETSDWRERFGFIHNQLSGDDDILSLDFVTSSFDESNAFTGSYDRPIVGDWLRGKVFGLWSEYTASDVGLPNQDFTGNSWAAGGELAANVYQQRELFVDVFLGVRYEHIEVTNELVDTTGATDFLLPTIGARLERSTDTAVTNMQVGVEWNASGLADTSQEQADLLGRLDPDINFTVLNWDLSHSFYLDKFFFGDSWYDTGPEGHATLAHELAISFRGQYAFNNRLIPNYEQTLGGLYTVRGYAESVAAGDTVIVGSMEYRFHLPQALGIDPNPGTLFGQSFRYKPQQAYGRADWDLVLRAFLDAGQTYNSEKQSYETDDTLVGTGFGIDLLYKRNLQLRLDFGWALEEIEGVTSAGSSQVYFVGTILF